MQIVATAAAATAPTMALGGSSQLRCLLGLCHHSSSVRGTVASLGGDPWAALAMVVTTP